MTRCSRFVAAVVVLLHAGAAFALTPAPTPRQHEIPLPEFLPAAPADAAARTATTAGAVAAAFGGRWHAYGYDAYIGAARWHYGSGPRVVAALDSRAGLESAARAVLRDLPPSLNLGAADLRLAGSPHVGGKWAAHFQQTVGGVDVWQAGATVVFTDDGKLMVIGSDVRRHVDVDTQPDLSAAEALARARADLPFPTYDAPDAPAPALLILPVPTSSYDEDYRLVWRVRFTSIDPLGAWVCHVDAHYGETVWRYNDIHVAYEGTAVGDVREDTYCLGHGDQPAAYLRLNVAGLGTVYTDAVGAWSIAGAGGPRQVTADLYSPYVDLNNVAGNQASFVGTAQEGVPLPVVFDDTNSRRDERDVFDAINDIRDFYATFDPTFGYTNRRIAANVGRTDGYCPGNAWWNGTINFCEAAGQYANTGEIQGVVHHEFGHGVQDFILGFQGLTGMGEGNADILANLMTRASIIGPGFFQGQCTAGIRDSDNRLTYPRDVVGQEDHYAGQVIAGFNWDAMSLLRSLLGDDEGTLVAARNWHEGRLLLLPADMPDQVFATFVADDDDGDLDNGTPHHAYYCQAAQNHGFACPAITVGVLLAHSPHGDTTDAGPFALDASIVSTEAALDPSQLALVYRVGGGAWTTAPLVSLGGDLYRGTVPAVAGGDVAYYFTAADVAGNASRLPALAPEYTFSFLVADAIDDLETAGAWTAGDPGDDATTGLWVRVDPNGTIAQPEDDHTAGGVTCWVTGQHLIGDGDGADDVDGGRTTLTSPVWDLTSYDQVQIRYWKWYSNDRGAAPAADWWDVQASNDGGTTWTSLEHTMASTAGWEAVTFDPVAMFGAAGQLRLRFVAADEGEGSLVEAAVDDIAIIAVAAATPVPDDDGLVVRPATTLAQNAPNPFNPLTEIAFAMARAGHATLRIYNAQGRLVRTLIDANLPAGLQTAIWDGLGDDARPAGSGVYLYRLVTDDDTLVRRMLLVK